MEGDEGLRVDADEGETGSVSLEQLGKHSDEHRSDLLVLQFINPLSIVYLLTQPSVPKDANMCVNEALELCFDIQRHYSVCHYDTLLFKSNLAKSLFF